MMQTAATPENPDVATDPAASIKRRFEVSASGMATHGRNMSINLEDQRNAFTAGTRTHP